MRATAFLVLFALGCSSSSSEQSGPTYHQDVAPLLAEHCTSCHSEGHIAPFSLTSYAEARNVASLVKTAVESRTMPPWHVDESGACGTFQGSRALGNEEIATIAAWVDAGTPEGDAAPPPEPRAPETLAQVSATLDPGVGYTPLPTLDDDYRCFVIDLGIAEDQFLTAYEVHPGEPSEVHHVVLYSVDTPAELDVAQALDNAEDGPGYTCFGAAGTGGGRSLAVWAPGTGATVYPAGTGLRLVGGMPIIMQVHYNRGTLPDRTTVDLTLAASVEREAIITAVLDLDLDLQPGSALVEESAAVQVPPLVAPVTIHGVYPHMHQLGRSLRVDLDRGEESACMVNVPRYDFNWQRFYFYDEAFVLDPPGGGFFRITCGYDTRGVDEPVHWGEGTGDEMCINAFYVTY